MKLSSTTAQWWERGAARGTAPLPQSVRASSRPLARSSSRGSGGRRKAATGSRRLQKVCVFNPLFDPPSPPNPLLSHWSYQLHSVSSEFLCFCLNATSPHYSPCVFFSPLAIRQKLLTKYLRIRIIWILEHEVTHKFFSHVY